MKMSDTNDGKLFTQDEVNKIVQERLAKEKAKYDTSLAEKETELKQREFQLTARETLAQKGLPLDLLDAMNTSSPDAFAKSLEIFESKMNIGPQQGGNAGMGGYAAAPMRTQLPHGAAPETPKGDIRAAMGLK
ncbi:hypothetical protein LJC60_05525 [Ruminococcaceae bacterium OttesenSCG-928-D13]|nr:hypothetical protein [Ruminococcaceae bacterium OttesenSCG-928-D13]